MGISIPRTVPRPFPLISLHYQLIIKAAAACLQNCLQKRFRKSSKIITAPHPLQACQNRLQYHLQNRLQYHLQNRLQRRFYRLYRLYRL